MTEILPPVAQAIEEVRCTFEECSVEVEEDGPGGAFVIVTGIRLGVPPIHRMTSGSVSRSPFNTRTPMCIRTSRMLTWRGLNGARARRGASGRVRSEVGR